MSIQQCLAYCRGFTKRFDAYSLLQETVCSCMKADTQLNLTQATCKKACSGNFMQQCGSTLDKVYSVYKLGKCEHFYSKSQNTLHHIDSKIYQFTLKQWCRNQAAKWFIVHTMTNKGPLGPLIVFYYFYEDTHI